jgi:hypothetical protein
VQTSIQTNTAASRMPAAEAALMRWYPGATLRSIQALRDELPGWPIVPAQARGGAA